MSVTLLLTTIAAQVGSAYFNSKRSKAQSAELAEQQQRLEEKIMLQGIENSREEYVQVCALQREIEQLMQKDRLELIQQNYLNSIELDAYNVSLEHWPLFTPPYVIKGQLIDGLSGANSKDAIPLNCIMTTSMHSKFNQKIFPQLEERLALFCSKHWNSSQPNSIRFYQNAWRDNIVDLGSRIIDLYAHLDDVPTIVLSPVVRNGKITFKIYWWGISKNAQDQHNNDAMTYDPELAITITDDLSLSEDQIKNVLGELTTKLATLISYFADLYYWHFYGIAPILPTLINSNYIAANLKGIIESAYLRLWVDESKNHADLERRMHLLRYISPVLPPEFVLQQVTTIFKKRFSYDKRVASDKISIEECFLEDDLFCPQDRHFLEDFRHTYNPSLTKSTLKVEMPEHANNIFPVDSQTYTAKRDELISIIETASKVDGVFDSDKAYLEDMERKIQEDQFRIVLIGEFQGGKSTSFNAFCDGREISPRGFGIKTSACKLSATNLSDSTAEEYARVIWKTDRELLMNIDSILEKHIDREILELADSDYRPLYEIFDLSNANHFEIVKIAVENEVERLKRINNVDDIDICKIGYLLINFYNNPAIKQMKMQEKFTIDAIAQLMVFPESFRNIWKQDISKIPPEDAIFVFVGCIDCFVHSKNLSRLGCSIVDCPGLFASAWDTKVAEAAIMQSDAILYLLGGDKEISLGDVKALEHIKQLGSVSIEDRLFIALNQTKSDDCTDSIIMKNELKLSELGFSEKKIYRYNALLFFLSEFAHHINDDRYNETVRRFMNLGRSRTNESASGLWIRMINKIYANLEIPSGDSSDDLRIHAIGESEIRQALQYSRKDELFEIIENYIIENKAHSILVDNGALTIARILLDTDERINRWVTDSFKTLEECEEEHLRTRAVLEEFKDSIETAFRNANLESTVIIPVVERGYNKIFSNNLFTDIAEKVTIELINQISFELKAQAIAAKFSASEEEIFRRKISWLLGSNSSLIFPGSKRPWQ